jgi:hypothetical protein
MPDSKDLVREAVKDAKALKEAALEAAKNEIVEAMTPGLKRLLEKQLRGSLKKEDTDRIRRGVEDNYPGESHTGFEEGVGEDKPMAEKNNKEMDLEELSAFFPDLDEVDPALGVQSQFQQPNVVAPVAAPVAPVAVSPMLGEGDEEEDKDMKKEADEYLDEEIEISEAELRKVYESALQTEVQVKGGFADMTKGGEEFDPAGGIADVKKGEHNWDDEEPPAKQDYTVKEIRTLLVKGLQENRQLREKLARMHELAKNAVHKLQEVNLFNAKVLYCNRLLNKYGRLTKEQKKSMLESIDRARSLNEARSIYEAIDSSFRAVESLMESSSARKPVPSAQRARTSGAPSQDVLSESVDRANGHDWSRTLQLAGLNKIVSR